MQLASLVSKCMTFSVEITPNINVDDLATLVALKPDFISLTDKAINDKQRHQLLQVADYLQNKSQIPVLMHLTGLYKTPQMVQKWVQILQKHNITNILALRGDVRVNQVAQSNFQHADALVRYLRTHFSDITIASSCYPTDQENEMQWLQQKESMGSDFFMSQFSFDIDLYQHFFQRIKDSTLYSPVIAGIMPILNVNQMKMVSTLTHQALPANLQNQLDAVLASSEFRDRGLAISQQQVRHLKCMGVRHLHVYSLNDIAAVKSLWQAWHHASR
jgi:methylenetetrahydrofolate reductase (NADPH)